MSEYKYTTGLMASGHGMRKLVKIEAEIYDSGVSLRSVSANTLGRIAGAGTVRLSAEEWADRSTDPYDSVVEARWALERCGWEICAE